MRVDRRGFLGTLGAALTLGLAGRGRSATSTGAVAVHATTANTLRGAIGATLRSLTPRPEPYKLYPEVTAVSLPEAEEGFALPLADALARDPPAAGFAGRTLSLARLAHLLTLSNGVTGHRDGSPLRAAPSAGALYAGEVYLVALRVEGLEAGAWSYRVEHHRLRRLRAGALEDTLLAAVEHPASLRGAAAVVCLSNVFHRYTWKYANRGYRYALVDSGHIGENLRLAASAAGLAVRSFPRFHDDRVNRLLGLDGREEAVCALHALGEPQEGTQDAPAARAFAEKGLDPALDLGSDVERYHEATKLVVASQGGRTPPERPEPSSQSATGRTLPAHRPPPGGPLERAIRQRRSTRRFEPGALEREDLGFVLQAAHAHRSRAAAAGLELYLAIHRVKELPPGLYRGVPSRSLSPVREGSLAKDLVEACLGQEKVGSAAVAFFMVGDVAREAARAGERRYRDLLVESGAIGQRIYLAAETLGLTARNLAAFLDRPLNELLGLDGRKPAVLHLTLLGRGD